MSDFEHLSKSAQRKLRKAKKRSSPFTSTPKLVTKTSEPVAQTMSKGGEEKLDDLGKALPKKHATRPAKQATAEQIMDKLKRDKRVLFGKITNRFKQDLAALCKFGKDSLEDEVTKCTELDLQLKGLQTEYLKYVSDDDAPMRRQISDSFAGYSKKLEEYIDRVSNALRILSGEETVVPDLDNVPEEADVSDDGQDNAFEGSEEEDEIVFASFETGFNLGYPKPIIKSAKGTTSDDHNSSNPFTTPGFRTKRPGARAPEKPPVKPAKPKATLDSRTIPKLKMPIFSGKDGENWAFFRESFKAIFANKGLTAEELVLHLEASLKDRPQRLVAHQIALGVNSRTYDAVWNMLQREYGGEVLENQMVTKHLDAMDPPANTSHGEMLRLVEVLTPIVTYYGAHDKTELTSSVSTLYRLAKRKIPPRMFHDYLQSCFNKGVNDCFETLYDYFVFQKELAQRVSKESSSGLPKKLSTRGQLQAFSRVNYDMCDDAADQLPQIAEEDLELDDDEDPTMLHAAMANHRQYGATRGRGRGSPAWRGSWAPRGSYGHAQARPAADASMCPLCKMSHALENCRMFKAMSTAKKYGVISRYRYCFKCLKTGHMVKDCTSRQQCDVKGCKRNHHTLIHPEPSSTMLNYEDYAVDHVFDNVSEFSYHPEMDDPQVKYVARETTIGISTVVCNLVANGRVRKVVALLDTGSSDTMIDEEIARDMGIIVDSDIPYVRNVAYADRGVECEQYVCEFTIQSLDGLCTKKVEGWTMSGLSRDSPVVDWRARAAKIAHLRDVPFDPLPENPNIHIIIGCDNSGFFRFLESRGDAEDFTAPVAFKTLLGWTCIGANSGLLTGAERSGATAYVNRLATTATNAVNAIAPSRLNARRLFPSYKKQLEQSEQKANFKVGCAKQCENVASNHSKVQVACKSDAEVCVKQTEDDELARVVERAWDLDHLGMAEKMQLVCGTKNQKKPPSEWTPHEKDVDSKMWVKYSLDKRRFICAVPWKKYPPELVNNLSEVRARQLRTNSERYLASKGITEQDIDEKFEDHLRKGYIRLVSDPTEPTRLDSWYLPYFPVVKKDRDSTKVRVVFDCAAKDHLGKSLNQAIEKGPNRLQDLLTILIRFRRFRWAFTADISEMFLQILLPDEDRKYHRFWWKHQIYEWLSILFGNQASPDASQKVLKAICDEFGTGFEVAVKALLEACYMDDCVQSTEHQSEAEKLAEQLPELLAKGGMKVHKIYSNCRNAVLRVPEELRSGKLHFSDKDEVFEATKVLGMIWDAKDDYFKYSCKFDSINSFTQSFGLSTPVTWTKRLILKCSATVYDPLGLICAFTVRSRSILQKLWNEKLEWDDPIPERFKTLWEDWLSDLFQLPGLIKVQRCLKMTSKRAFSFHVFADASTDAIAACVYIRLEPQTSRGEEDWIVDNKVDVALVVAKSRVTPSKVESTSRLELCACVLAVRLGVTVAQIFESDINEVNYWTDSKNCLYWLNTPSKFLKTYASNRVGEIQTFSSVSKWRHVPTDLNPADVPTRDLSIKELAKRKLWWFGPEFLRKDPSEWPKVFEPPKGDEDTYKEFKKDSLVGLRDGVNMFVVKLEDKSLTEMAKMFNPKYHSVGALWDGYARVMKNTAMFFSMLSAKITKKLVSYPIAMQMAINYQCRRAQLEDSDFVQLMDSLVSNEAVASDFKNYTPYLTRTKLVRSRSRLANVSELPTSTRYPILLPANVAFTRLLVQHYHMMYEHTVGIGAAKCQIRKSFIVLSLDKLLRSVRSKCLHCRKARAMPLEQQMADLPTYRFSKPLRAFAKVGLDFCGPFDVKVGRGKVRKKSYILVLTCLQTRAVHLEPTDSQSADDAINALSRFCDLRGLPSELLSDNFSTFVHADKELEQWVQNLDKDLLIEPTKYQVKWHFTPPRGPHHGGVYEIMVKSAKRALKVITENMDLTMEEFRTFVYRAMSLINSRPLQRVHCNNSSMILTPNHFLYGNLGGAVVSGDKLDSLKKRWLAVNTMVNKFWKQLFLEYIPELSKRRKWQQVQADINVGDVVLQLEPEQPRGMWELAVVEEIYPGEDGKVRRCRIRTANGTYDRPIVRLSPLEFVSTEKVD